MKTNYSSLEELRRKKEMLKNDVSEMEELLTFENTKESLSAFTNGFTDKYLDEKIDEDGETKLAIKGKEIVKEITEEVKEKMINKESMMGFASAAASTGIAEEALKMGAVGLIGNYTRKNLNHSSWKKKILGLAIVYLLPKVLRLIRKKLEQYQKNRSVSGMEQLI